jgi:hypothetical protein
VEGEYFCTKVCDPFDRRRPNLPPVPPASANVRARQGWSATRSTRHARRIYTHRERTLGAAEIGHITTLSATGLSVGLDVGLDTTATTDHQATTGHSGDAMVLRHGNASPPAAATSIAPEIVRRTTRHAVSSTIA